MSDAEPEAEVIVDRMAAAEAFELVADGTRLAILEALAAADGPLAFSTLRERAEVADPGRFNYHLGKLTGAYVTKGADGYELGVAGLRVVGAVLSGGYNQSFEDEVFETDAACPRCAAAMAASFEGEHAVLACPDCGLDFYRAPIPPGALAGRDPAQLPQLVDRYQKRRAWSSALGFCSFCDGQETITVYTEESGPVEGREREELGDEPLLFRSTCDRCGVEVSSVVVGAAYTVPAVQGFHAEHGIDLRGTPLWELPWLDGGTETVEAVDPLRVRVPVTLGDDRLDVVLDGDLGVVETQRRD